MSDSKLSFSLSEGHHKSFNQLIGNWQGETKTWFEPGDPVDDSPMNGTIRPMFDGRFVVHEYKGSFQGKELEGMAIYGYDLRLGKFQSAWMDTFHLGTGILLSEGVKDARFFNALGAYQAAADNSTTWGWRTSIEVMNENQIILTAYNITAEGEESKATETIYNRVP